jgi:cytokinin dehydrogenase
MIVSRRQMLSGMSALTVLGFDTSARAWVWGGNGSCNQLPSLDGELLIDPATLATYANDAGSLVHHAPIAVLKPGSVDDVKKMICYARAHSIWVAARGQGHTTFGQSMVDGGLVIDMSTLNEVHAIGSDTADVGAGLTWNALTTEAVGLGLTPPVLTGYLGLSIGGTLSMGGISSTNARGAQVDHVRALEVVTGGGDRVWCSKHHHRHLFEGVLAGLGQLGIITRAIVDLVPAPTMARVYTIDHTDPALFFADLFTLLERGELDDVYNFGFPDGAGGWVYQLTLAKFFEPSAPPDDEFLLRELSVDASVAVAQSIPYLNYVLRVDVVIDFFKAIGMWDGVQHPWFDVFVPEASVEDYVTNTVASLTPADVGPTGFLLLFPQKRSKLTRPNLRVPHSGKWVFLFDILTAAAAPGEDPVFASQMLARNRTLFEEARALGGTRYPIGALEFDHWDWKQHYGARWFELFLLKKIYDPKKILTPGPGIF